MSDMSTATVAELPPCDFCKRHGIHTLAAVDGKTVYGVWAFMCSDHYMIVGTGLGMGRGQLLIPLKGTE